MNRLLITLFAVLTVSSAIAQTPDIPVPSQISDLKWMVGTWTGKGKFSFQGTDMQVEVFMTCTVEGQFIKSVSDSDFGTMKMTETQFLGWDESKKEYTSYSFTSMAPTPRIERGKMDGAKLVTVSDTWDVMGTSMVDRSTVSKVSDTKMKTLLEFKDGDKWIVVNEMELTKK